MSPKVSVIIPAYNVEDFIDANVQSIVEQTFEDIEVICINDGSQDGTLKKLKAWAKKDKRIRFWDTPNGGLSRARNLGASHAKGNYLYFFDSDDMLVPTALEELVSAMETHELDVLYFDSDVFFDDPEMEAKYLHKMHYYHRKHDYGEPSTGESLFQRMVQYKEYLASACLQFIRRSYYVEKGLEFPPGLTFEDNYFTLQSMLQAQRAMHVPKPYFQRRYRKGSIMTTAYNPHKLWSSACIIGNMTQFLLEKDWEADTYICAEIVLRGMLTDAVLHYHKEVRKRLKDKGSKASLARNVWKSAQFNATRHFSGLQRWMANRKSP